MINILDGSILLDVSTAIVHAFRWLFGILSGLIYNLIVTAYDVFVYLSTLDFFNNEGLLGELYKRIGLILGLFMLFKIVFSLVQGLVDPNKFDEKNKGVTSIIIRSIISIVLLGIVPFIFKEAMSLQALLVGATNSDNNVLYKLIVGKKQPKTDNFGRTIAAELYFSFYRDDYDPWLAYSYDTTNPDAVNYGNKIDEMKAEIIDGDKNFYYPNEFFNTKIGDEYVVEYNEILSVVIGGVFLWIIVVYCVQLAIRIFQLAYLRLISPIPILSYINDPSGIFKKWVSQCTTTYLDLFIRLAIMYFVIFISSFVTEFINELDAGITGVYVEVFLLVGLFMFATKVPKLIGELLPSKGGAASFDFGLKAPKPLANVTRFGAGMALGAVGGAASNAIHGGINTFKAFRKDEDGNRNIAGGFKALGKAALSTIGGFGGGAVQGAKIKKFSFGNVANAVQVSNANRDKRQAKADAGYHWYNPIPAIEDSILSFAGETTKAQKQIKAAEFNIDALEQSKSMQWAEFAKKNPLADLSLLRSMQKFDVHGRPIWKAIDSEGKARTFEFRGGIYVCTDATGKGDIIGADARIVTDSATIDSKIRDQRKIIKGLQQADNDAKKK